MALKNKKPRYEVLKGSCKQGFVRRMTAFLKMDAVASCGQSYGQSKPASTQNVSGPPSLATKQIVRTRRIVSREAVAKDMVHVTKDPHVQVQILKAHGPCGGGTFVLALDPTLKDQQERKRIDPIPMYPTPDIYFFHRPGAKIQLASRNARACKEPRSLMGW